MPPTNLAIRRVDTAHEWNALVDPLRKGDLRYPRVAELPQRGPSELNMLERIQHRPRRRVVELERNRPLLGSDRLFRYEHDGPLERRAYAVPCTWISTCLFGTFSSSPVDAWAPANTDRIKVFGFHIFLVTAF